MVRKLLGTAVICAALVACGDDDGGTDAGPITLTDAGGGGVDAGGGGVDAGGGGVDAGTDPTCDPITVPRPTVSAGSEPCAATVKDCIDAATSQATYEACFTGISAECDGCLGQDLYADCTMKGCDQEYGDLSCCVIAECGSSPSMACQMTSTGAGGACAAVSSAVTTCFQGASCNFSDACFAAP